LNEAVEILGRRRRMSGTPPTTREVFDRPVPSGARHDQDFVEREFFSRVVLPNGTVKTTSANRVDDLNEAVLPFLERMAERPVQIMDVGVSSGVSTLEWFDSLSSKDVDCQITATDLTVYSWLLTLTPSLAVLVDRQRNILHLDVFGRGAPPKATGLQGVFAAAVRTLFGAAMMIDRNLPPRNGDHREAATGFLLKCEPVTLLTKRFVQHEDLRVVEDDLLAANRPEFAEAFHVVRAANILNRAYFSDEVLSQTVKKLKARLKKNGLLIVCRTAGNGTNNGTIFRLTPGSELRVLERVGSGSEIERLVTAV
jgi:hypothetical protein